MTFAKVDRPPVPVPQCLKEPKMHTTPPDLQAKELSFFDEENPRSLIRLLPPAVAQQVRLLWKGDDGYLLGLSEYDLFKECRNKGRQPQAVDNMIRVKFWLEYDRCQATGDSQIFMTHVISRTIGKEAFYKYFLTDTKRLAWMLCPSTDYRVQMEEALSFGVQKLRQFFEETDWTDTSVRGLERFLMAFRLLDERLNGARALPGKKPIEHIGKQVQGPVIGEERDKANEVVQDSIDKEIEERAERVRKLREKVASQGSNA